MAYALSTISAVILALAGISSSKGWSAPEDRANAGHILSTPGAIRSSLSTTGEHPFFVLSAASPGFVQAKDLRPGDQFFLSGGRHAFIASIVIEGAPMGETFTTYNFEVDQFHTYFAGPLGVWVHNSGPNYCGMMMGEMHRIATSRGLTTVVGQRTELLIDVVRNLDNRGIIIPHQEIAWAARRVCEYENGGYVTGEPWTRTYQWWNESFFNRLGVIRWRDGGGDFDIHHNAENRVLARLKVRFWVKLKLLTEDEWCGSWRDAAAIAH
ncbi:MAG: polymorphic toxin-type HINT domain-containing protein [Verrucomicrobiales bacterium]